MDPVKDTLGLNILGVYNIPCLCGHLYIGQTGRTVTIREIEHKRHLPLGNTEKSAIAQHGLNTGHMVKFEETALLHKLWICFSCWKNLSL